MNSSNAKRAWLLSVVSILLSVSMLVGSTFAWFTDTASTGVNTITAGNLNVELEYWVPDGANDQTIEEDEWHSVQGKDDLFRKDTLWEPGHTEVVYLRIRNAGTLALDYSMTAYAAAETTGINMKGDAFKLSEKLKFELTEPSTTAPTYLERTDVQTAAANGADLGQPITKENMAKQTTEYFALYVYMPSDVGNDANYMTGTAIPTIDLKIVLNATQAVNEHDSFGNTYDENADGTPDNPQFDEPLTTVETKASALPTTVTEENGTKTETVNTQTTVEAGGVSVTYPKDVKLDSTAAGTADKVAGESSADATQGLVYTGTEPDPTQSITIGEGNALAVYDLTLPVASDNTVPVKVVDQIGTGKVITTVYHNETALTLGEPAKGETLQDDAGYYTYDDQTGEFIVWVAHASFISIETKEDFSDTDARIGSVLYTSVKEAIAAAEDGDTITLMRDVTVDSTINLAKNITVNLNGKTWTANACIYPGRTDSYKNVEIEFTMKNGTYISAGWSSYIRCEGNAPCTAVFEDVTFVNGYNSTINKVIQTYARNEGIFNYTFENCVFDGTCAKFEGGSYDGAAYDYTMSMKDCEFKNGTVTNSDPYVYFNHYVYGNAVFENTTFTGASNGGSAIEGGGNSSMGTGHKMVYTLKDCSVALTNTNTKNGVAPVDFTWPAWNEIKVEGTTSFTVDGYAVPWDGVVCEFQKTGSATVEKRCSLTSASRYIGTAYSKPGELKLTWDCNGAGYPESFTLPVGVTFNTNGLKYTGTVSAPNGYTVECSNGIYSLVADNS